MTEQTRSFEVTDSFLHNERSLDEQRLFDIAAEVTSTYNLAMQQNFVPVLGFVRITNNSHTSSARAKLAISANPEFFEPVEFEIPEIVAGKTFELKEPQLKVSAEYLLRLKERITTTLIIKATFADSTAVHESNVILLAFNECDGYMCLPELISAFIQPNSPTVELILANAAATLKKWGQSSAISGYQSKDPGVACNIAGAIFAAISSCQINYCVPPASFESGGQKIRFPEVILDNKLGTCLDLTLFFCACLEQAGLNSLVILTRNHAFAGLWLKDESFPLCFVDNSLALRKRVELKEIMVFETTTVTHDNSDFSIATRIGEQKLLDDDYVGCIDIKRCRSTHILPLPIFFDGLKVGIKVQHSGEIARSDNAKPVELLQPVFVESKTSDKQSENRIDQWKRKLLDLSLRNRLLNYRVTAKTIQLVCGSLASLEDCLADGKEFRIKSLPSDIEAGRSSQAHLVGTGNDIRTEFVQREFLQSRLYSPVGEVALEKNLLEVFRDSRNSLEEGGTNTLYLAMGFLYWQESKSANTLRAAPIILVPLEIRRNSVKEGFTISKRDEESQINVTLLELLKQDFNIDIQGLDPLPLDEHGIDLDRTLNTIRQHILNLENWEVREEAVIGNFQFRKFLMYKDLELRSSRLLENKVVNHLVNTKESKFPDQGDFPDARRIDSDFSLNQTFCPTSADSSQLAAVYAAAAGRSFVLHGPPGTGKSQTITNIIAHSLAVGKSVLFVSEKAAALNVVYSRLAKIGLGNFCLELHSNKSRKAEVLDQLKRALNRQVNDNTETWQLTAQNLQALRTELNDYAATLHHKHENGHSFFKALSLLTNMHETPDISLDWEKFADLTVLQLEAIKNCLNHIYLLGNDYGQLADSPWKQVMTKEWSPEFNRTVMDLLGKISIAGRSLLSKCPAISELCGSQRFADSLDSLQTLAVILKTTMALPAGGAELLASDNYPVTHRAVNKLIESGKKRNQLRAELAQRFDEKILQLNTPEFVTNWQNACTSIWPLSWFRKRTQIANLQQYCKEGFSVSENDINTVFALVNEYQAECAAIGAADDMGFKLFGQHWNDGDPDWSFIESLASDVERFLREIETFCNLTLENSLEIRQALVALYKRTSSETKNAGLINSLSEFVSTIETFSQLHERITTALEISSIPSGPMSENYRMVAVITRHAAGWLESIELFRAHCQLNQAISEAENLGLKDLMADLREGRIAYKDLWPSFKKAYLTRWAEKKASTSNNLRNFSGTLHDDKINRFRELDEDFLKLSAQAVVAKVAERAPAISANVANSSELGILNREIQKKARHKPLRILFSEISKLLPRIKPCLLMSPISVAQYLAPDHPPFDLVIFDEASQVPVWDAIGAIARGKDLIVVGDPKQLPPTSFFGRSESQEWEESELTEDMESILDDCLASGLPSMHLRWHYRSLHESLITFSNANYYDNGLHTFPAARFAGLGVKFRYIANGIYDKGKSRTNQVEARAVVAEIVKRLENPEMAKHSIGVVTFSVAQQTLIEDLLDDARRSKPELEDFFSDKCPEPVFIKNLESVQGDERDVIIFSICYGPDPEGKVSMNFGPLNKSGGERRLNVAITRARRELLVISSLKGDMISLSKTRAVGVRDLKLFLDYAERGVRALTEAIAPGSTDDYESPFEEAVGKAVKTLGYEVHTQVGCSGYRIDLAVVHPEIEGRYLLGIECDGASYHSAHSARERDKLRHAVLESLGWKLHRVWSTEWWHNPKQEIEKIKQKIVQCLAEEPDDTCSNDKIGFLIDDETDVSEEIDNESLLSDREKAVSYFSEWKNGMPPMPAEAFDRISSNHIITRMIEEITAVEGPVSLSQVSRKVCSQFNISRATQRITNRVLTLAKQSKVHIDKRHQQIYFWCSPAQIDDFLIYRQHTAESRRKPEDICPDELANAALAVLKANISMTEDDLVKHTAQCFGFSRVGQNVANAVQAGLSHLYSTRGVENVNGKVSLN
ncbi:MAG: DUF3320 domain-containing protein [Candidatus Riflebacteria bacterium]|nr:DUF3320 domain-containing protein [Candidatus Riflebacteria bacterium]